MYIILLCFLFAFVFGEILRKISTATPAYMKAMRFFKMFNGNSFLADKKLYPIVNRNHYVNLQNLWVDTEEE